MEVLVGNDPIKIVPTSTKYAGYENHGPDKRLCRTAHTSSRHKKRKPAAWLSSPIVEKIKNNGYALAVLRSSYVHGHATLRTLAMESISSKKRMQGAAARAFSNSSRTFDSDSPNHIDSSSGPAQDKKKQDESHHTMRYHVV